MAEEKKLTWSTESEEAIREIRSRYPTSRAAVMAVLWLAQTDFNHISDDVARLVAETLDLPLIQVQEVVSFYVMYHRNPVGKHVIWMCRNLSCEMRGFGEIKAAIEKKLDIKEGETTKDGAFTLLSNECLGACGGAPMVQIDDQFYENLTPESASQLLDRIAAKG